MRPCLQTKERKKVKHALWNQYHLQHKHAVTSYNFLSFKVHYASVIFQ